MPEDNDSVNLSYVLNVMNERLNRQEGMLGGIYEYFNAQKKAAKGGLTADEGASYGHLYHLVENVNIWNEKIHGEPKKTDVTSTLIACRLVGNEDMFSVITDGGASYFMGLLAGNGAAEIDYKELSKEDDLIGSLVELYYGPAADLTGQVLNDIDRINENENRVGYSVNGAETYRAEQGVNIDEHGNMNFSIQNNDLDYNGRLDSEDSDSVSRAYI